MRNAVRRPTRSMPIAAILAITAAISKPAPRRSSGRRPEDVIAYAAGLEAAGLKGTTIQRRLSAVRQFHRFLFAEQLSSDNPATTASAPKPAAALPTVMSEGEVSRLLATARAEAETAGPGQRQRARRLLCLVELLYATGLRVSELVGLSRRRRAARRPLLHGARQGRQERMVPLRPGARRHAALARAQGRQGAACRRGSLFPSASATPAPVAAGFRARAESAGGAGRPRSAKCMHPHVLRHAFASISCKPAPISARCSRCSAMPTSRRRRSTPMSRRAAARISSKTIIRLPTGDGKLSGKLTAGSQVATFQCPCPLPGADAHLSRI